MGRQAVLLESSGIVTQRKQALAVFVNINLRVLDARNLRLWPAAPARTAVLLVQLACPSLRRIDPCGGWRTRTPPRRCGASRPSSRTLGVARLYWDQWPRDDGRCQRFLDNRACGALQAWRPQWRGFGLLVVRGQAAQCARRRRRWRRRQGKSGDGDGVAVLSRTRTLRFRFERRYREGALPPLRFVLPRSCKPTAFLTMNEGWSLLASFCVKSKNKMVSVLEYLWNFKTLLVSF